MTPTPSNGLPPTAKSSPPVRILALFPPRLIDATTADQVAAFKDPCAPRNRLAADLGREPREQNSFVLIAHVEAAAVGYLKLQHGAKRKGICWIRDLVVSPSHRRRGLGAALVRYAFELVTPHEQLAVEVREIDTVAQLFLAAAGLECLPPWDRDRRQLERHVYEFRSVRASAPPWQGRPRFTWPPGT